MNGFNSENQADWDTERLEELGDTAARLRKQGICVHGHLNLNDPVTCLNCGKVFASEEEAFQAHAEAMQG